MTRSHRTLVYPGIARWRIVLLSFLLSAQPSSLLASEIPEFRKSAWFGEQVREQWFAEGIRLLVNAPGQFERSKPTRLIFFATPNGNSLEQTMGCITEGKTDWRFDTQHIAAQVRRFREVAGATQTVLACLEAEGLSWPTWNKTRQDGPKTIRNVVQTVQQWISAKEISIILAGHSGGGSFLFGFIDAEEEIPNEIQRLIFLDANYSYSDAHKHGDKILAWLKKQASHQLVVIAYDDRNVRLNGKLVVGPGGGTFRATDRMVGSFTQKGIELVESTSGDFRILKGMNEQISILVHKNPQNKVLHTALVGEMNGLLRGLSNDPPKEKWGTVGGPRAYTKWIQPAPALPKRPDDAVGGKAFFQAMEKLARDQREEAIATEFLRGNFPDFLRSFKQLKFATKDVSGKEQSATVEVMPDYLSIGSNEDFVRVPMNPRTACRIAEAFGCSLPTRKIVDAIHANATVKLEPYPLTETREAIATFVQHHQLIEEQRKGSKLGEFVSGIKKDLVLSNRLEEKPNRVAIYGWHKRDGKPIQPLNIAHIYWYVDYSHGVRLIKRRIEIDGQPRDLRRLLFSEKLSRLVSDEGPLRRIDY
ncbi:MAG TPA: hypothetical protein VMF69_08730 [Gemmataceae bacterium]|nr:hypothetical protein [Gemmataceae bacterium]